MFPRRVPQVLVGVPVVPGDTACESVPRVPQRTNRVADRYRRRLTVRDLAWPTDETGSPRPVLPAAAPGARRGRVRGACGAVSRSRSGRRDDWLVVGAGERRSTTVAMRDEQHAAR